MSQGRGAVGAVLFGICILEELLSIMRIGAAVLIEIGRVLMRLSATRERQSRRKGILPPLRTGGAFKVFPLGLYRNHGSGPFCRLDVLAIEAVHRLVCHFTQALRAKAVKRRPQDRKSTRLNPVTNAQLVCPLLLEQNNHRLSPPKQ